MDQEAESYIVGAIDVASCQHQNKQINNEMHMNDDYNLYHNLPITTRWYLSDDTIIKLSSFKFHTLCKLFITYMLLVASGRT